MATTEIYTLSLHDALPISAREGRGPRLRQEEELRVPVLHEHCVRAEISIELTKNRSEEHTSELQSRLHLVCRLLLEKKKIQSLKNLMSSRSFSAPSFPL